MTHTDGKPGEPTQTSFTKRTPETPERQVTTHERKLTPDLRLKQQEWRERIRRTVTRLLGRNRLRQRSPAPPSPQGRECFPCPGRPRAAEAWM
jgi:hypothetical protein